MGRRVERVPRWNRASPSPASGYSGDRISDSRLELFAVDSLRRSPVLSRGRYWDRATERSSGRGKRMLSESSCTCDSVSSSNPQHRRAWWISLGTHAKACTDRPRAIGTFALPASELSRAQTRRNSPLNPDRRSGARAITLSCGRFQTE